jgi:hypothetical protein
MRNPGWNDIQTLEGDMTEFVDLTYQDWLKQINNRMAVRVWLNVMRKRCQWVKAQKVKGDHRIMRVIDYEWWLIIKSAELFPFPSTIKEQKLKKGKS